MQCFVTGSCPASIGCHARFAIPMVRAKTGGSDREGKRLRKIAVLSDDVIVPNFCPKAGADFDLTPSIQLVRPLISRSYLWSPIFYHAWQHPRPSRPSSHSSRQKGYRITGVLDVGLGRSRTCALLVVVLRMCFRCFDFLQPFFFSLAFFRLTQLDSNCYISLPCEDGVKLAGQYTCCHRRRGTRPTRHWNE